LLLGFLAVVVTVGIGLIAWRGDRLRTPGRLDSPVSRESAFLLNNLLFAGFALVVLLGTVYPLLT
jgi:cytochrome c-type biogenesis protein CcmF